ncbi:histone deacetylase family protein [Gynuella sunshinyii]|uniref:Deacetylase, including histone deacetylase and acetoin utilization protein n=1 Tax=Gynuella sunshinyii YC6258 TaxID=1445510 RepID=A0A0C5VH88_9GAMM|nr:histone deacetylase family protein [Gynuella sunshinyii]AJQ94017.1 deacetylase, including histone deacetylase and acetoin utilization protein [Gynuella sunshinyii YC6258]
MITVISRQHSIHNPKFEFYRGEKVPCFESPQRLEYVIQALHDRGHDVREAEQLSDRVLPTVHSQRYLQFLASAWDQWTALAADNIDKQPFPSVWPVRSLRSDIEPKNFIARLGLYSMDNGTPMAAGTWVAAKAGADAAVSAVALLNAGHTSAFCATRPPGHHAGPDFMGGYCFLNNAAIAAQSLRDSGCQRVAIIDVDYHHGNGTQTIFYDRPDVLFVSLHGDPRTEYPFYLGHADETGRGAGQGYNLNLPMTAGTDTATWFAALDTACRQIIRFQADALVISLGLDTFAEDPISRFTLQSDDFFHIGTRLATLRLPTVFIMEGGYATTALGHNTVNVLEGFDNAY